MTWIISVLFQSVVFVRPSGDPTKQERARFERKLYSSNSISAHWNGLLLWLRVLKYCSIKRSYSVSMLCFRKRQFFFKHVEAEADTDLVKYEAILEVNRGALSKTEVAKKVGVPISTLSCWLASKDSIIKAFESWTFGGNVKRRRTSDYPDIEASLTKWFVKARLGMDCYRRTTEEEDRWNWQRARARQFHSVIRLAD